MMSSNFYRISKGITFAGLSAPPSAPANGDCYYDTALNQFQFYQNGSWAAPGAAPGANVTLSNLTTTAINQSLLPNGDVTFDLGSAARRWTNLFATNAVDGSSVQSVNFGFRGLYDPTGTIAVLWQTRTLRDSLSNTVINWSSAASGLDLVTNKIINVADPITPQGAATKNYVDGKVGAAIAEFDAGNSGTALTINFSNSTAQKVTLTGNCTFTFSNPANGQTYLLKLVQDATGSRTATWPAAVKWSGSAPILSTAAAKIDLISFYYDGTNYFGTYSLGY